MRTELSGARSCPHPHGRSPTPSGSNPVPLKGGAMEQSTTGHDAVDDGDRIDWHQVARLVRRGRLPRLALRIVR